MKSIVKSILNLLQKDIEALVAGFLLGAITLLIFFEVLTRFLFAYTPPGTEEIEILFYIWFVLLGSVTVTKKYAHVKIEVFVSRLRPVQRQFLLLVVDMLVIIFLIFVVISGIRYVKTEMLSVSAILEIPEGYFVLSIPSCGFLMMIYRLISIKRNYRNYLYTKKGRL